ncbi:MAG TPA: hypothetical protein PKN12_10850 [Bacteroidales bacterium]|jgi:hypothetical protein|nr:hypothetical protein [Bacteroidales bacterium]HPT09442.1 hypothetical protein [Bacteroidales bacterium]
MKNYTLPVAAPENPGIRFYAGLALFIFSFFMLPIGFFLKGLYASHLMKGLILAVFWISAPLMKVIAIGTMGKPSYLWIKYKLHFYRRLAFPRQVTPARYNVGLILFIIPFIPNYILAYAPHLLPQDYLIRIIIHLFCDFVFIISLFVLGGNFWDKLRALFIYSAKVSFKKDSASAPSDR